MESSIHSFIQPSGHLWCARQSAECEPHDPVPHPTTSSHLEARWAPLHSSTHFLWVLTQGDFLSPSISKPFPKCDSATCFQGEHWQIIKKEECEAGLPWMGKTFFFFFLASSCPAPFRVSKRAFCGPHSLVRWKRKDLSSSRLDFIPLDEWIQQMMSEPLVCIKYFAGMGDKNTETVSQLSNWLNVWLDCAG